jgi:hypothetical protein
MALRLKQFGFDQSAPPAHNTAAWNRAVSCVPAIGARIIIEDGVYQHYGLSLKHQKNVSIIGGGGDHSKTRRTQLLEASGQTHCLTIEGGQYIGSRWPDVGALGICLSLCSTQAAWLS